jgi:hypothetical protein
MLCTRLQCSSLPRARARPHHLQDELKEMRIPLEEQANLLEEIRELAADKKVSPPECAVDVCTSSQCADDCKPARTAQTDITLKDLDDRYVLTLAGLWAAMIMSWMSLRHDIKDMKNDIGHKIKDMKTELGAKIKGVETELGAKTQGMGTDLGAKIETLIDGVRRMREQPPASTSQPQPTPPAEPPAAGLAPSPNPGPLSELQPSASTPSAHHHRPSHPSPAMTFRTPPLSAEQIPPDARPLSLQSG